jgi:hypothetical protein
MPYSTRQQQLAYQNEWTKRRRQEWLASNGPCPCGSSDRLEVDHKDPSLKVTHRIWTWSKARRDVELAKCQVLCHDCHWKKTKIQTFGPIQHGSGYERNCRCRICKGWNAIRTRLRRQGYLRFARGV